MYNKMIIPYFPNPFSLNDYHSIISDKNDDLNITELGFSSKYQFVNNASQGIYLLLRSFNLEPGSKVGSSPLLCNSVTSAILKAGLSPYYFDITKDYILDYDEKYFNKSGISALILPHLYGSLHPDTEKIVNWCKNNKIFLLSDTAQSFGLIFNDKPAIELGDGGVYSFGFGKASSCAGGALVYNLHSRIDYKNNPFINSINITISKSNLANRIFDLDVYKRNNLLSLFRNYLSQFASVYNLGITKIQYNSLKKYLQNRDEIQTKRTNNFSILKNNLNPNYFIIPESFRASLKFKYIFSLNLEEDKIADFTSAMIKNGIEIHPCSRTDSVYTQDKVLPNFHKIKNRLLELSTESSIPEDNFYKASDIMNSYFK